MLLGTITVLGALLRIWSPGRIGLWGDEVQFLNVSALPSYKAIVAFLYAHESHPPLYYFMARLAGVVTGNAQGVMAVVALSASIALIPAAWWLASLSGRRGAGPVAAALVAASVPLAILGVQLRPYSLFSLLLMLSVGTLLRAIGSLSVGWKGAWAGLMLLLLYLHHLAAFVFIAEVVPLAWVIWRSGDATRAAKMWAPWVIAVAVLAVPDVLMLYHQHALTGYLPAGTVDPLLAFRQFARLCLTFPGELLLGVFACGAVLWRRWRVGDGNSGEAPQASIMAGVFLTVCLLLIAAGFSQSILVEHLVLPFAPLAQVVAGTLVVTIASDRRVSGLLWSQFAVACVVLSSLFSVGYTKTTLNLMARYIAAESTPTDLIVLLPGFLGGALNRYLGVPLSQIDYPVIGPEPLYRFDRQISRIMAAEPLGMSLDSISAASAAGRRVWLIIPTKWITGSGPQRQMSDPRSGQAAAFEAQAGILRQHLVHNFGQPNITMSAPDLSWSMEVLTLELFAHPDSGG